jgi:hypothetical protein
VRSLVSFELIRSELLVWSIILVVIYELCRIGNVSVSCSVRYCWQSVIVLKKGQRYVMTLPECLLCVVSCAFPSYDGTNQYSEHLPICINNKNEVKFQFI